MDMNRYLDVFVEETRENLQQMNKSLLKLEKNPEDVSEMNEIFRIAHTLKGMSGTMGFGRMSKLTHIMEDVLDRMRNENTFVETAMVDLLFRAFDVLEEYTINISSTGNEGDNDQEEILKALQEAAGNDFVDAKQEQGFPSKTEKGLPDGIEGLLDSYDVSILKKAINMEMNIYTIDVKLDKGCLLKSARAFVVFKTMEEHGEIVKSVPPVEEIEDEKFELSFSVIFISEKSEKYVKNQIETVPEVESAKVRKLEESDLIPTDGKSGAKHGISPGTVKKKQDITGKDKAEDRGKHTGIGKTVRVDIDRLDVLLNLVSELIIQKTRIKDIGISENSHEFNEAVEYLERITTNLHDAVMKVRMVQIERVFNRFPRMIRDLSKELGKKINLTMSGEETELDRTVVDEIGDPLIHLLRNCADHGLENASERRKLNKPEEGNICLKAYQNGNDVVIEVSDDGRGINLQKVKEHAVEVGIIEQDYANSLTREEIIDFLFRPNFSTANKVTDLSGRGVGLDAVKTKIETLGGRIEVQTEEGNGSKFIVSLPLTLAIIQALLVTVGKEKYAIPLVNVNRITRVKPEEIRTVHNKEVISVHGSVVPLIRLNKVLDVEAIQGKDKNMTVVIIQKGERLMGYLVDGLIGQQEIVLKPLGKYLAGTRHVAGATILGDGMVALILDVNSIA